MLNKLIKKKKLLKIYIDMKKKLTKFLPAQLKDLNLVDFIGL